MEFISGFLSVFKSSINKVNWYLLCGVIIISRVTQLIIFKYDDNFMSLGNMINSNEDTINLIVLISIIVIIYRCSLFIKEKYDKIKSQKLLLKKVLNSFGIEHEKYFFLQFYSSHDNKFIISALIDNASIIQGMTAHMTQMGFIYLPNQQFIDFDMRVYNLNPRVLAILNKTILPTLQFEEDEN